MMKEEVSEQFHQRFRAVLNQCGSGRTELRVRVLFPGGRSALFGNR